MNTRNVLRPRNAGRMPALPSLLAGVVLLMTASWGCNSSSERSPNSGEEPDNAAAPGRHGHRDYAPHSVLVRFKDAGPAQVRSSVLAGIKASFEDRNHDGIYDRFANLDQPGLMKLDLDPSMSVEAALERLRKDPTVQYAEPNYLQRIDTTPNDARFSELYGLHNTGQTGGTADADIDAVEAWNVTTGSSDIVVGVVDTGVDYNHVDLAANMWVNPGEIAGNGIDDDGDGVIDDVHGFNAITGSGNPMDDHSHGTHCSGTIGGVGGNNLGVAGVNWHVSIMAIKFLSADGSGTLADAIAGIDYAVGRKNAGVDLRVLSNSWGGGGFSQALRDAISAANDADILFVAAAGNAGSDNDTNPAYPASYDVANVVSVAATDHNDALAYFSNFGATSVDLGAPGVSVLSTTPGDTYSSFSGTSMATPHVAGVAALVLASNSTLSTEELKSLLITSGDSKSALAGRTVSGRRLNAANALAQAGPPLPRFTLAATPSSLAINQADTATYTVNVGDVAGFTGDVSLSVTSQPALDAVLTVTPSVVAAPGAATFTVATTMATTPGVYRLTITGTSGELTTSRVVTLRVRPFGTVEVSYPSTDTPLAIPDGDAAGIASTIHVLESFELQQARVDLSITHGWNYNLRVTLTSPDGTLVVLHDHSGDDLHRSFAFPSEFIGVGAAGDWVLRVYDTFSFDTGTLDHWTLNLSNVPSVASFTLTATPASQVVSQYDYADYGISVGSIEGFSGTVNLSMTSEPALDASIFFSSSSVRAPGSPTLYVSTSCNTAPGTYALTITGTSGAITRTAQVSLTVLPYGATTAAYTSSDTPRSIPDNNPSGLTSTIQVNENRQILALSAEVHITHTAIGDLTVELLGPDGQSVLLHDRSGGSDDNLNRTYPVTAFDGLSSEGAWRLKVTDGSGLQVGRLDRWTLHTTAVQVAPTAQFYFNSNYYSISFIDYSGDAYGCTSGYITNWQWDFGDGANSTDRNPTHVYATAGTYQVILTVTDNDGYTDSITREVVATRPPPQLSIERITRNRTTFEFAVDLSWSGAEGALVDLKRNGVLVNIPNNDGAHRDVFRRYETSFTWVICEQQSFFCSNQVSVVFGNSLDSADEVTIITARPDGTSVSRFVPIEDEP
jgi:serine protease